MEFSRVHASAKALIFQIIIKQSLGNTSSHAEYGGTPPSRRPHRDVKRSIET